MDNRGIQKPVVNKPDFQELTLVFMRRANNLRPSPMSCLLDQSWGSPDAALQMVCMVAFIDASPLVCGGADIPQHIAS